MKQAVDKYTDATCGSQVDCGRDLICFDIQYEKVDVEELICQETSTCNEDVDCAEGSVCTKSKGLSR